MTKEQAIQYIIRHSEKWGLTYEVLQTFHSFCDAMESLGATLNYAKEAEDALYEWDI